MSFGPFPSIFNQLMIRIDHLLMIVLCFNGFVVFQEFIMKNTALVPQDTKHVFFAKVIWSWCWRTGFTRGQPLFSPLRAFQINPLFVTSHSSVQKWLSFLALKQYITSVFAMGFVDHLNCVGPFYKFY